MNQQNTNRILPAMTAEAYFEHKEVIEAWLQGADVEYLEALDDTWYYAPNPGFIEQSQYRIKPANIKKYVIVGYDGNYYHHTNDVWNSKIETCSADSKKGMRSYNKQRTLIELEINPSSGKVVAAKVVE